MENFNTKGNLIIIDLWLEKHIEFNDIKKLIQTGINKANLNIVKTIFHQYKPQGETFVWLLSESHCSLHNYPEHNFLALDIYICGDNDIKAQVLAKYILTNFNIRKKRITTRKRG